MNKIKSIVEELSGRVSSMWAWIVFAVAIIVLVVITCCEKKKSDDDGPVI